MNHLVTATTAAELERRQRVVEGEIVGHGEELAIAASRTIGPLEPTLVPAVEAARQLRSELRERYPAATFSVRKTRPRRIEVQHDGRVAREEIESIVEAYVGYWYEGYLGGDGGVYRDLPGRWVGARFVRYDVDYIGVCTLPRVGADDLPLGERESGEGQP